MKKFLLLGLVLWSFLLSGQNNPYCLYDFAGWYRLSTVDPSTGTITQINPIPVVGFYVLGNKQTISTHDSTYIFAGHDGTDVRLYTVTLDSANIVHNPVFNSNVVGLKYNCNDSTIYAIEENGGGYDFVTVDNITGTTTTLGFISGVTAYVGDAFVLDEDKGRYHFFGLFGGLIKLYSVDIKTGNVVSSPFFPDNVTGLAYNCQDSTIYGLWEDSVDYKLEAINPTTGTHSTVGILANIDPGFVAESATIDANGYYVYRGFSNTNFVMVTVDVTNANVIYATPFTDNISGLDHFACCAAPLSTSVTEIESNSGLTVYPNPSLGISRISWSDEEQPLAIRIIDLNGKEVWNEENLNGNSVELVTTNFSKGIYLIRLIGQNQVVRTAKLVVN